MATSRPLCFSGFYVLDVVDRSDLQVRLLCFMYRSIQSADELLV